MKALVSHLSDIAMQLKDHPDALTGNSKVHYCYHAAIAGLNAILDEKAKAHGNAHGSKMDNDPDVIQLREAIGFALQRAPTDEAAFPKANSVNIDAPRPFTVIGVRPDTGQIVSHHVLANDGLHAFAVLAAQDNRDLEMTVALEGHQNEGEILTFPGEGVVDSQTIREQPDVFGEAIPVPSKQTPCRK